MLCRINNVIDSTCKEAPTNNAPATSLVWVRLTGGPGASLSRPQAHHIHTLMEARARGVQSKKVPQGPLYIIGVQVSIYIE